MIETMELADEKIKSYKYASHVQEGRGKLGRLK